MDRAAPGRRVRWLRAGVAVLVFLIAACDPGSTIVIEQQGDAGCAVSMRTNDTDFAVSMELACETGGTACYEMTALSCDGVPKTGSVPIDLTGVDGCPGEDWCVASCATGLEAPGRLWDTPSLLAVDGCNVYEDDDTAGG